MEGAHANQGVGLFRYVSVKGILFVFFALLIAAPLRAQQEGSHPFYAGPTLADIFGTPSIDRSAGAVVAFGTNGQGNSYDNAYLIGGRDLLPTLISPTIGLSSSISLGRGSGQFISDPFAVLSTTPNEQYRVTTSYAFIDLSSAIHIPIGTSFFARCGLYLNYQLSQSSSEQLEWIGTGASTFTGGATTVPVSAEHLTVPPLHFGIPFEFGNQIDLPSERLLQFAILARWDIPETARGYFIRSWSAGLSATILLPVSTIAPAPDVFVSAVHLRAASNLSGGDERAIVVGVRDTLMRRFVSLPDRYHMQIAPSNASTPHDFELSSLDRQPIPEIAKHLGDIVALRMREHPTDTLAAFSPLVNEWRERSFVLPTVDVEKNMYATKGIKDWRVTVTEGSDTLASYRMHGPIESNLLALPSGGLTELSPILATLVVIDSGNAVCVARDTAVLRYQAIGDRDSATVEEFWLAPSRIDDPRSWDKVLYDRLITDASRASRIEIRPAFELAEGDRVGFVERLLRAVAARSSRAGSASSTPDPQPKIEVVREGVYAEPPRQDPFASWMRVRLFLR